VGIALLLVGDGVLGRILGTLEGQCPHDRHFGKTQPAEEIEQGRVELPGLEIEQRLFDGELELVVVAKRKFQLVHQGLNPGKRPARDDRFQHDMEERFRGGG
jgi:hypothetical protein